MIPKVIYKTGPILNPKINKINQNLEKLNPDWSIKYYNDEDCLNFLLNDFQNDNPHFKQNVIKGYNKLIPKAYKADLWRLCIIYQYGGLYLDFSSELYFPIEKIINLQKDFIIALDACGRGLQIGFFAGIKNHPFLKKYICQILINIKNKYYGIGSLSPTGPMCAWNVAYEYNYIDKIDIPIKLYAGGKFKLRESLQTVGKRKKKKS